MFSQPDMQSVSYWNQLSMNASNNYPHMQPHNRMPVFEHYTSIISYTMYIIYTGIYVHSKIKAIELDVAEVSSASPPPPPPPPACIYNN